MGTWKADITRNLDERCNWLLQRFLGLSHVLTLSSQGIQELNMETIMSSKVVLSLPSEDEIETTVERRISESPSLIEKTIRYKNGMQVKLIQNFAGKVFRLLMNCSNDSLWISDQRVMWRGE
jgi:hypothetical protein